MRKWELERLRSKLLRLMPAERTRLSGWIAWLAMGLPAPMRTMRAFQATLNPPPVTLAPVRKWGRQPGDRRKAYVIGGHEWRRAGDMYGGRSK